MSRVGWKDSAEIVGIAAIVGSLLFVGLELRQSQQIAIAGQYQQRAESYINTMFGLLQYESMQKQLADRARRTYSSLISAESLDSMSDEEIAVIYTEVNANLALFDNNYFQYQSGLSTEESWQMQRRRLARALKFSEHMRAEVLVRGDRYRDSFHALVLEIISEIE